MKTPSSITLTDGAYTLDGGSIHLFGQEPEGTTHHIALAQHQLAGNFGHDFVPGRLHLDGVPIPVRSDAEFQLIAALRRAVIAPKSDIPDTPSGEQRIVLSGDIEEYLTKAGESPAAALMLLLKRVLDFVASDEYLAVAAKVAAMAPYSSRPSDKGPR